eukprot:8049956-Ditylum_brightwellii.AAC.1
MITCNIKSELPLSEDEHTQVSASETSGIKQSGNKPLTAPTDKPLASAVRDKLILMMQKIENNLKQDIQDIQESQKSQANKFTGYISELSTKVISNTESLQKIKSNLNSVTQT